MTYVGFRSYGINKHHLSPFSSPLSSFFFSCPLLSRETNREEQSTAATWRWRQPRLFVTLLLLPFRERGVIAIATRTRTTRSQPDRLSFLVGDHHWPRRDAFPKTFCRYCVSWKLSNWRVLAGKAWNSRAR